MSKKPPLSRNVVIHHGDALVRKLTDGKTEFAGEWVAIPREDYYEACILINDLTDQIARLSVHGNLEFTREGL